MLCDGKPSPFNRPAALFAKDIRARHRPSCRFTLRPGHPFLPSLTTRSGFALKCGRTGSAALAGAVARRWPPTYSWEGKGLDPAGGRYTG